MEYPSNITPEQVLNAIRTVSKFLKANEELEGPWIVSLQNDIDTLEGFVTDDL